MQTHTTVEGVTGNTGVSQNSLTVLGDVSNKLRHPFSEVLYIHHC